MLTSITIASDVAERFPDYAAVVLFARGLTNTGASDVVAAELHRAVDHRRHAFTYASPGEHPALAAWRNAYSAFGASKKYMCSPEAMMRRLLRPDGQIPSISPIVDAANAVSIASLVPIGAEDADGVQGALLLRTARGDELFEPISVDAESERPSPGEVVWVDDAGVTCRRWNWRQCRRTMVTPTSVNVYFVLDRLVPVDLHTVLAAADELSALLREIADCRIERAVLQASGERSWTP